MRTTRLRITLDEVEPAVTRVIDVPQNSTLPELHDLLQVSIGWTDSHLHQFVDADNTAYGVPHEDDDWMEQQDGRGLHLDIPAPPPALNRRDDDTGAGMVLERTDILGGLIHEYRRAA